MGQPCADDAPSAAREPRAPLMVHDGIAGIRACLSTGVSTLVAIMAAHRIAAREVTAKPAAPQNNVDRISAALTEDRAAGEWRG